MNDARIVSGCQISGQSWRIPLLVTETPVEVKALMDAAKPGDLVEVHVRTGASAYFRPSEVTMLAPLWKSVDG